MKFLGFILYSSFDLILSIVFHGSVMVDFAILHVVERSQRLKCSMIMKLPAWSHNMESVDLVLDSISSFVEIRAHVN